MKYLDINADEGATPLNQGKVAAVMLFPQHNDRVRRDRFLRAWTVAMLRKQWTTSPILFEAAVRSDGPAVIEVLADGPKFSEFNLAELHRRGAVVGGALFEAIGWHDLNPTMSGIDQVRRNVAARCGVNVDARTLKRWWKENEAVLHLWAARAHIAGEAVHGAAALPPFPCALSDLGRFLAIGEHYRTHGETIVPKQAHQPILRPGRALLTPASDQLPKVEVTTVRKSN